MCLYHMINIIRWLFPQNMLQMLQELNDLQHEQLLDSTILFAPISGSSLKMREVLPLLLLTNICLISSINESLTELFCLADTLRYSIYYLLANLYLI